MRERLVTWAVAALIVSGLAFAATFTDVDTAKYHGKTGLKAMTSVLDANFALVESGTITPSTSSLTNGQALTVAGSVYILTGIGGANDTTNTVTLANPTAAGQSVELIVSGSSTNLIGLADSGNLKLSAAAVLDNNDVLVLRAVSTSAWVETSRSNN